MIAGSAVAWPLTTHAQQSNQQRRIGVLMVDAENDPEGQSHAKAIRDGLQKLGWTAERNIGLTIAGRLEMPVASVHLQKNSWQCSPMSSLLVPLRQLRRLRPGRVQFPSYSQPSLTQSAAGLSRTWRVRAPTLLGLQILKCSISGKWLGLLKEIAPHVAQVTMFNPETVPYAPYYVRPLEAAARSFKVEPISAAVHDDAAIERVIATLARDSNGGLIVLPDAFTTSDHRKNIIEQAARNHLPVIYPYRFIVEEGGLMHANRYH